MAAIQPSDLFANYASDGTEITIPIADLPGLTSGEAHATTGDGRELVRTFLEKVVTSIEALASGDRPTKMTVARSNVVGIGPSSVRRTYTFTFEEAITVSSTSLVAEAQ